MADEGFNQLRLPKLAGVAFSDMTLYRRKRNAAIAIQKPVFCLIGANGLGKSTFLNAVVYAITGAIPDPDRAFQSAREYFAEASKPEKVREYFGGRLSEADRPLANIKVKLIWPAAGPDADATELDVIRPLADGTAVSQLTELRGGTKSVLSGPEADARYRELIIGLTGIGDFAQFAFLIHFVLMFDEARHLLMWDDRVLTNALYLAFGVGADAVEQASAKTRAMEREASLSRNVRYAAKVVSDRKAQLADLLSNNASTTTDHIELKATFDRLVAAVDSASKFVADKDRELRAAEVELADAASRVTDLQIAYRQVFSERLAGRADARFHPAVEETLRTDLCAVCGASEATARVQLKLDGSQCPLCDATVVADDGAEGLLAELRRIDERLTGERGKVEDIGARRERLKRERASAEASEGQARDALAAFEANNENAANLADPRDATMVKEEMDRLDTEYDALVRRSEDHRRARDRIRDELRNIETGLQDRYERASTKFVPRFRALAEEFIGLPIDIELEQRRGAEITGFGLRMKMDDKLRLSSDRLSESQRFFLDIALRMALSEFMSPAGSTMLIDTPEGSLDIAYEARAGNMFDSYSRAGNDIMMTANVRSSKLIERLAQTAKRERMQVVKMTEWADLSAVQLAEERLFDDEYKAIEKALG